MDTRGWSTRAIGRYALFHVPPAFLLVLILIVVRQWLDLPAWFIWSFVALGVAKDVVMFPFVWRAYDRDGRADQHQMVGMRGTAMERLDPSGYVRVRGELWHAEVMGGCAPIDEGQSVRVRGIHGLTLVVQADNRESTDLSPDKRSQICS